MKSKPKLKISTRDKSYNLIDSPLYKLKNKKRLAQLLNINLCDFRTLTSDDENYSVFEQLSKKGKVRKIQKPVHKLDVVHTRIASLICRIQTPLYLHSGKKNMFQY